MSALLPPLRSEDLDIEDPATQGILLSYLVDRFGGRLPLWAERRGLSILRANGAIAPNTLLRALSEPLGRCPAAGCSRWSGPMMLAKRTAWGAACPRCRHLLEAM